MPIALPAKQIAWNRALQIRCSYTTLARAAADVMFAVANELINVRGFTCKGSSNGVAAGMDGVFRWASGADAAVAAIVENAAQSWVVISLGGGRGDFVMSHNNRPSGGSGPTRGDIFDIWWSPGGVATAQGTPTFEPTATDKSAPLTFVNTLSPGNTTIGTGTFDRLVSIWSRPDKGGFRVAVATGNAWGALWGVDVFTPDEYGAGITVVDATMFYINGAWNGLASAAALNAQIFDASSAAQKKFLGRRSDGAGVHLDFAHKMKFVGASGGGSPSITADISVTPELQGGAIYPMKKYGLYSITAGSRGDVGTMIDWYLSRTGVSDGDTAGGLAWICVENTVSMWWDWDGVTPVVMS